MNDRLVLRPRTISRIDPIFARHARLVITDEGVDARLPGRRRRKITGVAEVVRVQRDGEPLGMVELRDASGVALARIPVDAWTNASRSGARFTRPVDPPSRPADYVARKVADVLGVPQREGDGGEPDGDTIDGRAWYAEWLPVLTYASIPACAALALLAVLCHALGAAVAAQALLLASAALAAVSVVVGSITWHGMTRGSWRRRASDSYRPPPGGSGPFAVSRLARLARVGDEFVLAIAPGQEQWFGGPGEPLGIARITLSGRDRAPSVDLVASDGVVLAQLPYDDWVGSDDGLGELAAFSGRSGIELEPEPTGASGSGQARKEVLDAHAVMAWPIGIVTVALIPVFIIVIGGPWPVTVWTAAAAIVVALVTAAAAITSAVRQRSFRAGASS